MKRLVHASLFSGIGGFDLAAEWSGFNNAFNCEIDQFCTKILKYHFPNSEHYDDIKKTDFTKWRGKIDILTGGFPCQPFSLAGNRKGTEDDRYLWPQMLRAIREIQPAWVVGENVAGILTMVQPGKEVEVGRPTSLFGEDYTVEEMHRQYVVETVCTDLEREGYSVQPFVIPACAVGAPHRRDRVWFVARRVAANTLRTGRQELDAAAKPREALLSDSEGDARRNTPDPADAGVETLQCGREDGVLAVGVITDPDLNRQRERTHQQIPVTERQETPDDCTCSQDGTAPHPDEYRHTPCTAGGGTETERQERATMQGERPVGSQRTDGLSGLQRTACNPDGKGLEGGARTELQGREYGFADASLPADRWRNFPTQSPVCSRDDGFPVPMDGITFSKWRQESIKAYGNAIVPQVAYEIFKAIIQNE